MNKTIENIVEIIEAICITIFLTAVLITVIVASNRDEQIKYLEQSLNEQIEEKQVYMNMLEERSK